MNFAVITGGELAQILTTLGVILAGFYGFAYKQMQDARKERETRDKAFLLSIETNTKATLEIKDFLVNLNGSLKRVVKEKQSKAKE